MLDPRHGEIDREAGQRQQEQAGEQFRDLQPLTGLVAPACRLGGLQLRLPGRLPQPVQPLRVPVDVTEWLTSVPVQLHFTTSPRRIDTFAGANA